MNKVKHVKTHFRHAESDGHFNYAIPPGKHSGALIVRIPRRTVYYGGLTTEIKMATRGLDDGVTGGWQITRKTFIIFGV